MAASNLASEAAEVARGRFIYDPKPVFIKPRHRSPDVADAMAMTMGFNIQKEIDKAKVDLLIYGAGIMDKTNLFLTEGMRMHLDQMNYERATRHENDQDLKITQTNLHAAKKSRNKKLASLKNLIKSNNKLLFQTRKNNKQLRMQEENINRAINTTRMELRVTKAEIKKRKNAEPMGYVEWESSRIFWSAITPGQKSEKYAEYRVQHALDKQSN